METDSPPQPKVPRAAKPISSGANLAHLYWCAHERLSRPDMIRATYNPAGKAENSRSMVRNFLSALSPNYSEPPKLSIDLDRLGRIIKWVFDAVESDILTEDEGEAMMNFVGECFVHRRLDEVLAKVTRAKSGSWFLMHHQAKEE
jgi:hypothetical protein